MKRRVLFYSSVNDINLFKITGFYVEDVASLKEAGFSVICTNKFISFLKFWNYDIAFLYFYKKSLLPGLIAKLFLKKIIYTGGIDELNEIDKNKSINKILYIFLFRINYLLSTKCNIVSKNDLINVKFSLNLLYPTSPKKLSYHPHSINVARLFASNISFL